MLEIIADTVLFLVLIANGVSWYDFMNLTCSGIMI
jgi:hypothetical protein